MPDYSDLLPDIPPEQANQLILDKLKNKPSPVPETSPEGTSAAHDLAPYALGSVAGGLLAKGAAALAPKLGMFFAAKPAVQKAAEKMVEAGESPENIWRKLNAFQGKDSFWRTEALGPASLKKGWQPSDNVPDSDVARLSDVVDQPHMYKNEPASKNIWMDQIATSPKNRAGYFPYHKEYQKPSEAGIGVNPDYVGKPTELSDIQHEGQHFLQNHYGWSFQEDQDPYYEAWNQRYRKWADRYADLNRKAGREPTLIGNQEEEARKQADFETYHQSASEVEARNAARREAKWREINATEGPEAAERWRVANPPFKYDLNYGEDVPREQQHISRALLNARRPSPVKSDNVPKTDKQLSRMTAKELADHGFSLGLGERDLYRFGGGPIQRNALIENIKARQDQIEQNKSVSNTSQTYHELGQLQRGDPEMSMLRVQKATGGGVLNPVVEHAGDLVHRMTDNARYGDYGYGTVKNKVDKVHSWLTHPYGFEREMNQNIANNAAYRGVPEDTIRSQVDSALKRFGEDHSKLPAYNDAHRTANEINMHIGNKNWEGAIKGLEKLKSKLNSREEWDAYASQGLKK